MNTLIGNTMTFQQQVSSIQAMIKHYGVTELAPVRLTMKGSEIQDVDFVINGVRIYCCVNYTAGRVTWRNEETGELIQVL